MRWREKLFEDEPYSYGHTSAVARQESVFFMSPFEHSI